MDYIGTKLIEWIEEEEKSAKDYVRLAEKLSFWQFSKKDINKLKEMANEELSHSRFLEGLLDKIMRWPG